MRYFLLLFLTVSLIGCRENPATDVAEDPFAGDIPEPVSAKVSLAGSDEPDIVRYLKVHTANSPALSPDGEQLAYLTRLTGEFQIWVTETGETGAPQQITFGNSVTFHEWSPAGTEIIYGTDKEGNEREGFYMITPDGSNERELLAPSDAFRYFGGFNKDGTKICYSTTERNGRDFDIHIYDLENGQDRYVYPGQLGYYPVSFSPSGEYLLISETVGEDANNIYLLQIQDSILTQLNSKEAMSAYESFQWTEDESGFYLLSNEGREFMDVAYFDLETKNMQWLITNEMDIEQIILSQDENQLHWVVNNGGFSEHHIYHLDDQKELVSPDWPRGILRLTKAARADVYAAFVTNPQVPGDIWIWREDRSESERITRSSMAGIDMSTMVFPEHHSFPARDGLTIHGLLYTPENTTAEMPIVITVHGGPTAQARPDFDALSQYLIKKGFVVFDLNYRGSTGYGKTFARENNQRKRAVEYFDLEDAVKYLDSLKIGDTDHVAIMGGSYGGYLTMAAMTRLPEVFDCGVAFVGVSNWVTALEGASPSLKAGDRYEYGDIDDPEDREFFSSISPIRYIDQVKSPVMVVHGANDPRDPVTESDLFVQGIRENGGEVEYLRFPDEGHGIRKMENRVTAYVRVAEFLEEKLKKGEVENPQ